jgi:hypothetical protein
VPNGTGPFTIRATPWLSIHKTEKAAVGRLFLYSFSVAAAAAKENEKRDDDDPGAVIVKEMAEAVIHQKVLHKFRSGCPYAIILCERAQSVRIFPATLA